MKIIIVPTHSVKDGGTYTFVEYLIKTQNDSLHSLSLVKNDETILEKLKTFHPETDYVKNLAYNTLGHLRCFKNIKDLNFEIDDFDACAEDSYRVMFMK